MLFIIEQHECLREAASKPAASRHNKSCREKPVSPVQGVVAVYRSSIRDIHAFAHAPHTVERGSSVQWGLVLRITGPGRMLLLLLPLCPPPVSRSGDGSAASAPALLVKGGTLLLSVGNTADGAMGGAFVGVLIWQLLLLPETSVLGQRATEATSQGTRRRRSDRKGGFFCGNRQGGRQELLLRLARRL